MDDLCSVSRVTRETPTYTHRPGVWSFPLSSITILAPRTHIPSQISYVLVDEENRNILALAGVIVESLFDGMVVCLCIDDEEVLLGFWGWGYVLFGSASCVGGSFGALTPMPARSRPVTESWEEVSIILSGQLVDRTSSPMTARNCLSLYADGGAAMVTMLCRGNGI